MNNKSENAETLRGLAGTMTKLRITRTTPCEPRVNGFVLDSNNDWFLLWQFHDFYPDGFALMRVDGVTNIRCGKYERQWTKMIADEGIAQALPNPNLALGDIHNMLSQLQSLDANFIIECEDDDEEIEDFYIGRLINLSPDTCEFANFDGLGCWDDTLHNIALNEITCIQWDTPYANTFSRHLAGPCPF
ncbi:MAG: hypothetical protein COA78_17315 [Blastopirellula sp.]|nr:MAG: hypothetical protein COA78_17315 [Blastopirellula sp.]